MTYRVAECPRCRQMRAVLTVPGTKAEQISLRTHYWPGGKPIPDRAQNEVCPGSRKRLPADQAKRV